VLRDCRKMRPQTGGWLLQKWSGIRESNPRLDLRKAAVPGVSSIESAI
jgi:hypothetical protein